jgi:hypothetical protein
MHTYIHSYSALTHDRMQTYVHKCIHTFSALLHAAHTNIPREIRLRIWRVFKSLMISRETMHRIWRVFKNLISSQQTWMLSCMYVCMYVCMAKGHQCLYVCTLEVWPKVINVPWLGGMYVCMYVCMYDQKWSMCHGLEAWMLVCMWACTYVCMYV